MRKTADKILMFHDAGDRQERERCTYCNAEVCTGGLIFTVNTKHGGIVCGKCAREKAPDVFNMRDEAWKFAEADDEVMRKEGECDAVVKIIEIQEAAQLKRDAESVGFLRVH